MDEKKSVAILIPAYNPSGTIVDIVNELAGHGFPIVVVNDGSDKEHEQVFEEIKNTAYVINHEYNQGKGMALKTGIKYLHTSIVNLEGFITADADGQHSVKDILRVEEAMKETDGIVLGVRNLGKDIPIKSKIGNDMSRYMFAVVTGIYLEDNQAGLRGFPMELCEWLESVPGTYYEYEMSMLVKAAKKGINIKKISIETIYIDNNAETHFKPVLDTVRIQRSIIRNGLVSFLIYAAAFTGLFLGNYYDIEQVVYPAVLLLFVVHLFTVGKAVNLKTGIIIFIKYALVAALMALTECSVILAVIAIIAGIVLIPVVTYVAAYITGDQVTG